MGRSYLLFTTEFSHYFQFLLTFLINHQFGGLLAGGYAREVSIPAESLKLYQYLLALQRKNKKNSMVLILLNVYSCKRPDQKYQLNVDQLLDFVKADSESSIIFGYLDQPFFGVDFDSNVKQMTFEQTITDKANQVFKPVLCFV